MGHGVEDRDTPLPELEAATAARVASTLQALATPSRLLIVSRLRREPCSVTELGEAVGMQQSAVSHQLRLLRNLGLVTATRAGQRIVYDLHDHHVAMLLEQAIFHSEHLRLGLRDPVMARAADAVSS